MKQNGFEFDCLYLETNVILLHPRELKYSIQHIFPSDNPYWGENKEFN